MKVAIVFSLLVAFVASVSITPRPGTTSAATTTTTTGRPICETEGCKRAGQTLKESLNTSVNPCDDFFEFACGGWIEKHPIAADRGSIGSFDLLDQNMREQVKSVIENAKPEAGRAASVQYVIDQYHLCLDKDQREKLGIEPLKTVLSQSIGQWPILKPTDQNKKTGSDWITSYIKTFVQTTLSPLFSITVQPDANQTTVKRITFDAPDFGLGRKEHADHATNKAVVEAYKTLMEQISKKFVNSPADDKLLKEKLEEAFDFEERLALASTPQEDRRDASVWYNRMTLKEFNKLTNNTIDWIELINQSFKALKISNKVDQETLVIVSDIPYYKAVSKLLVHEASQYRILNYLGWVIAENYAGYTSRPLLDALFQYSKVVSGVQKEEAPWKRCYSQANEDFSWAISRLYIEKFIPQGTKEKASAIIQGLRESFNQILHTSQWLDEATRVRAIDKLEHIKQNVAFPDWVKDNAELDKYHNIKSEKIVAGAYLQTAIQAKALSLNKQFAELNLPVNLSTSWPMPPAIVNAAYEPTQNSITIPAGILNGVFFGADRPTMLNFGGIGAVIGHEITHGFDDQGREFDKNGNLISWWSDKTLKNFETRAQCIVNQYSKIVDPVAKVHLNGKNTQGENIADNGGVRESYQAYENFVKKNGQEPLVPYLTEYSAEQIFYIAYANVWCGQKRPASLKKQINYDPHSPARYRVNIPLSNADTFAKAFNCPANSKMNTKDRCIVW